MPGSIENYVQTLLNATADSPIISASNIVLDMRTNRSGLIRYDDTPHYPEIESFPHHKHIEQEIAVLASKPPDLAGVLSEIERLFPLKR